MVRNAQRIRRSISPQKGTRKMKRTTYVCDRCARETDKDGFLQNISHKIGPEDLTEVGDWCQRCIESVLAHIQKKERYRKKPEAVS